MTLQNVPHSLPPLRPTSPHLQIYRLPLTALMSISHRITGVILSAGLILVAAWLVAAAMGPESYAFVQGITSSVWGMVFLFLWSLVLYYHLCTGLRHLFWDTGLFFEKKSALKSGLVVLGAAAFLAAGTWLCVLMS